MTTDASGLRVSEVPVDEMFLNRWSPRSFAPKRVPAETIATLFEAARWTMSCFNEQPWLFLYATSDEDLALYRSLLTEGNRWADSAPFLGFVLARRHFNKTGKQNRQAPFDAGAAWMAFTMEARRHGLYTHGMAGFHLELAHEKLGVKTDDYDIMAAFALGWLAERSTLSPEAAERDSKRSQRKPLAHVAMAGLNR